MFELLRYPGRFAPDPAWLICLIQQEVIQAYYGEFGCDKETLQNGMLFRAALKLEAAMFSKKLTQCEFLVAGAIGVCQFKYDQESYNYEEIKTEATTQENIDVNSTGD